MTSTFNANSDCNGESTARLAILYESDLKVNIFGAFAKPEYWIDLYKDSQSTSLFHSRFHESNSTWSVNNWDGGYNAGDLCATYKTSTMYFKSHPCSNNKEIMCEIVL